MDPCKNITCVNGECVRSNDSFDASCECSPGYTGDLCDTGGKLTKKNSCHIKKAGIASYYSDPLSINRKLELLK